VLQAVVDITPDQYPDIRKLMERCQVRTNLFLYMNKFLRESLSKEKQNKNHENLIFTAIKKLVVYVSFYERAILCRFLCTVEGCA
jgi:hypothetical protein